ncbi:hypothetical protein V6N11_033577 [Hibiscus sabdariffa]|uniref:Uncharacterized protein n=1 Tax=Hibiscus sabdariffa TaxID=183260 RepID=A0ABR2PZ42_9ROSI
MTQLHATSYQATKPLATSKGVILSDSGLSMQFHLLVAENCKLAAGPSASVAHGSYCSDSSFLLHRPCPAHIRTLVRGSKPWLAIVSFSSAFITLLSMSSNTISIRARHLLEESIPEKPELP